MFVLSLLGDAATSVFGESVATGSDFGDSLGVGSAVGSGVGVSVGIGVGSVRGGS